MNLKLISIKVSVLASLIIGTSSAWAGTVTIDMKNAYSVTDSNGNTTISCTPPDKPAVDTSTLPPRTLREWLNAFERLNNISANRSTPGPLYEYYKALYSRHREGYALPPGGLFLY